MMLRNLVLTLSIVIFVGALIVTPFFPGAWPGVLWGGILLLGVAGERFHYMGSQPVDGQWESTGERFLDPETGKRVDVQYDRRSGKRRYRESN